MECPAGRYLFFADTKKTAIVLRKLFSMVFIADSQLPFTVLKLVYLVTDMVGSISIELHNIISRHPRFVTAFTQH